MTIDATNVVAFQRPRPKAAAPLTFIEARLRDADCSIQMTCVAEDGEHVVFEYVLAGPTNAADCERLRVAWAAWRSANATTTAS